MTLARRLALGARCQSRRSGSYCLASHSATASVSARHSSAVSSRHVPGYSDRSASGPMRVRTSRSRVADRFTHPTDLTVAALVDREAQHTGLGLRHLGRGGDARRRARRRCEAAQSRRPTPLPRRPRRGTPCRHRATGWAIRFARSPSLVSSSSPSVSTSSRPTEKTRGSSGTSSTTVGRPWVSLLVVTTPTGLLSR